MRGIDFVVDDNGTKKAVLIDLTENGELWEDFYDAAIADERKDEPRESLREVEQRLSLHDSTG